MALYQTMKDLQAQDAQFQEIFLNLSKGQEELKALLTENMTKKNPEDKKEDQLKQLLDEIANMRIQMMGQTAHIQNLAWGKKELITLINKLHQDEYSRMGRTTRMGDQIINQPLMRQEVSLVKSRSSRISITSQFQQRPRQQQ